MDKFSLQADRMLNDAMGTLEEQLREAEAKFEQEGRALETRSRMVSCNDLSVLAEIVADSKRINDELYASYESLIRAANGICKPLADQGVLSTTLERVVEFMEHINSECSTLGTNYSASVNYESLGTVASTRYAPTAEARLIEANWRTLHELHPDVVEERERKAALPDRAEVEVELTPELAEWKAKFDQVMAVREELFEKAKQAERDKARAQNAREHQKRIEELEKDRDDTVSRLQDALLTVATAKFFQGKKKREAQEHADWLKGCLQREEDRLAKLKAEGPAEISDAKLDEQLEKEFLDACRAIETENPLPRSPRTPNPTMIAGEVTSASVRAGIAKMLKVAGVPLCISDIMMACGDCEGLSSQRVSAYMRLAMTEDRTIERIDGVGRGYFRAF